MELLSLSRTITISCQAKSSCILLVTWFCFDLSPSSSSSLFFTKLPVLLVHFVPNLPSRRHCHYTCMFFSLTHSSWLRLLSMSGDFCSQLPLNMRIWCSGLIELAVIYYIPMPLILCFSHRAICFVLIFLSFSSWIVRMFEWTYTHTHTHIASKYWGQTSTASSRRRHQLSVLVSSILVRTPNGLYSLRAFIFFFWPCALML